MQILKETLYHSGKIIGTPLDSNSQQDAEDFLTALINECTTIYDKTRNIDLHVKIIGKSILWSHNLTTLTYSYNTSI